ncbi:hypothetical protein AO735_12815 [Pseudomonas sp. TTU2014-096BSC]|uniref:restriction endonuclease subunit S n=1 Tax=Stutzerimonas nitrititolerans TaxID=2482751 RepID=UPI0007189C66|nr:restriction endonuclease subunit S [Stutzerimonas nitrititolerans]KRW74212.1 hypothetical protein AO735_12815 [Pseudomonas sp. TTU2014-096BSC]
MSELPEGWVTAALGDVCGQPAQRVPSADEEFTYIDIASIDRERKIISEPQRLPGAEAPSRARKLLERGDVIVSMTRPNLNAVALVGELHNECIASTGFDVLKPFEVEPRWIFAAVRSTQFVNAMCDKVQGALYPAVKSADIREHEIPLPPLAEQTRIAQKLDELLAQVDTLKARIDGIPALLKRFRQSVLAAAVSGRLTEEWRKNYPENPIDLEALPNSPKTRRGVPDTVRFPEVLETFQSPETWIWASAAKLLKKGLFIDLKDGNHGANHPKTSEFTAKGLPFITAANVSSSGVIDYLNAPKVSGKALEKLRVGFAEPDDVIFTHKGTVGRVALNSQKCVLTPQTTYYRLNQSAISSQYLSVFLQSNRFQVQTDEIKSQTTRDFIPITAQYELFHLLPPAQEQTEIVRRVEQLFAFANQLEAKVASAKSRIDHLTQSILAKVFRGELVPQDPSDEPASVLLERIQAQRAAAPKAKRGRKASA